MDLSAFFALPRFFALVSVTGLSVMFGTCAACVTGHISPDAGLGVILSTMTIMFALVGLRFAWSLK